MSVSSGWVCGRCQRHLQPIFARPPMQALMRRSFVSLQDAPNLPANELEVPAKKPTQKHVKAAGKQAPKSDSASDAFLEKLFKSTGREPPAAPLHLQYSRRTLSFTTADQQPVQGDHTSTRRDPTSHVKRHLGPGSRGRDVAGRRRGKTQVAADSSSQVDRTHKQGTSGGQDTLLVGDHGGFGVSGTHAGPRDSPGLPVKEEDGVESERGPMNRPSGRQRKETPTIRRIRGAIRAKDVRLVKDIFLRYQQEVRGGKYESQEHNITSTYTSMLSAFSDAKIYGLTADVWAAIKERGTPTLKQWSLMLDLARKQRDLTSLHAIWTAMQGENVLPDNISWATYISGIGREGHAAMMDALTELEQQWTYLAHKGKDTVQKMPMTDILRHTPSILPYNAALEQVVFVRSDKIIKEILERAKRMGLAPTVETFNVLLKRGMRMDNTDFQVQAVLRSMTEANVQPDAITITTLISGTLRNISEGEKPDAIAMNVKQLFEDLDKWDSTPEPHVYTTATRILLTSEPPRIDAARSVLSHMRDKGIEPSAHIYTVLVKHYFNHGRKVLIDDLFQRAKQREIRVDSYFFDRLIEGFARSGETDRMLDCLRQLPYVGMPPSWSALTQAVLALAESQDWETCKEIIQDIESVRGIGSLGIRVSPKEEGRFWSVVNDLRQEGVVPS